MAMPVAHQPALPIAALQQMADELEVPEGFRVEIIGEELVVSPTPLGPHAYLVAALQDTLSPRRPRGTVVVQNVTIEVTATGERYIPDLLVYPAKPIREEEVWLFPAEEALLVVEVVSPSNPENDRVRKVRGYAKAGIPLYLLIDPYSEQAMLFSNLGDDAYKTHTTASFGAAVALPDPLGISIDLTFEEPHYDG